MTNTEFLVYLALTLGGGVLLLAGFVPYKGSLLQRFVSWCRDTQYKRQWLKQSAFEHQHPIVLRREP